MIFKLEYKNKDLDVARMEIITPGLVEKTIEGTEDPFRLIYKLDKPYKSGHFLTSSAEINIYETEEFNIDALKTSNETEIKVDYYINNIKKWTGFVIPDFFSKEIGKRSVVSMVASDRIGTLKGVTLTDLNAFVSLRTLAEKCLLNTGLSLPLNTMVDLEADAVNFFNIDALSQRLVDNKGRSISCYDILSSILVASNSIILQRNAEWYIVNKLQHELGQGKLYSNSTTFTNWQDIIHNFSDVTVGARRTIIPVAASTGVYHEHGGGMLHPDNYDFSKGLTGWSAVGDFTASIDNRQIDGFSTQGGQAGYFPIYGAATENSYLVNYNQYERNVNPIYLESAEITIPYNGNGAIEVEVDVNATGPLTYPGSSFAPATLRISVVAVSGTETLTLDHSGKFIPMPSTNPPIFSKDFGKALPVNDVYKADSIGMKVKGTLEVGSLENYKLKVRIYGGTGGRTILVNMVSLSMKNTQEIPKGTIFKTEQGSNYTKEHEIETAIFGDYLTGGLNGYFYNYPIDDTSSLYSNGVLTSKWTDITDPGVERSLLHHITTQRSRMFSRAHDLVSAEMDMRLFDPLSIYVACSKRYTLVSATVDFLRGRANLEIEEAVYQNLTKRDFIYSYFGDGEDNIKSIGGISGGVGGGGTGGGLTPEQLEIISWWKKDPVNPNTIFTEMNAYSKGELSAYGVGSGGSSGGGVDLLQAWTDYNATKDNWAVKAGLLVPFYNDMQSRVGALEAGGGGGGSNVTWGTESGGYILLTVEGVSKSVALSTHTHSQYALTTHNHSGVYEPAFTKNTAFNKDFGTTSGTVAEGNHTHTFASLTSKPTTLTGYGITDAYTKTEVNSALTSKLDKSVFDDLFEKVEVSTGVFAIKANYNFYGVGEISAYGLGTGGSGGGSYDRLDAWADYNSTKSGWVLSALLGNELNTRVGNLEGGSALTVNTTGTGNAITSISKAGTVITATKGLTFSLDGHTHAYLPLSGGTMANTNLVTNLNADLLDGYHSNRFALQGAPAISTDFLVWDGATLFGLRAWAPSTPNYPGDPYGTALDFKDATTWYHRLAFGTSGRIRYYNGINTTTLTKRGDLAFTTDNVASATKLQTARTIWGQSFDGTGNVTGALSGVAGLVGNVSALGVETSVGNVGGAVFDGSANSFRPYTSQAGIENLGRADIRWNNVYAVNGDFSSTVTAPTFIGALSGNASSATKLQTARTIAGVSFDGTANIAIPFANLSSKPTTLAGYGITDFTSHNNSTPINPANTTVNAIGYADSVSLFGQIDGGLINIAYSTAWQSQIFQDFRTGQIALRGKNNGTWTDWRTVWDSVNLSPVTLDTAQTITGAKTFDANITLGVNRYISGTDNYTGVWNVDNKLWRFGSSSSGSVSNIRSEKIGIGTDTPSAKLHVVGNILATGTTTTTKVIFNSAGWSMEQVGSELQMKHNNVVAQRFLSDGSIVGLGEITAYGASTGGEGVSLLRTGGTMTGNLTMSADIIMNSGRAIGVSNLPLKLLGNALTYNASNVLTEANTATQIKMGNGWTIEQTTSALTIKKNGVVKGTFNA